MNKRFFLIVRTLLYIFLLIIILKTILELTTSFQYKFVLPLPLLILYYIPPLISSISAPIWLNILFFINFLMLILEPLSIKKFNYKINTIYTIINIFLNSIFLIYLFLNFKLIEIDRNIFLPVSEIYYYKLTFYLFIAYFSIVIYTTYDKLQFVIKKCSK